MGFTVSRCMSVWYKTLNMSVDTAVIAVCSCDDAALIWVDV